MSAQKNLDQTLGKSTGGRRLVEQEFERQSQTICLIPSENHVSVPSSQRSERSHHSTPRLCHRRYYEGQQVIDELEPLRSRGRGSSSVSITPTSSPTRARPPTLPSTWPSSSPATR